MLSIGIALRAISFDGHTGESQLTAKVYVDFPTSHQHCSPNRVPTNLRIVYIFGIATFPNPECVAEVEMFLMCVFALSKLMFDPETHCFELLKF